MASAEPSLLDLPSPGSRRARADEAPRVELDACYYDPRHSRPAAVRVFASEVSLRVSGAAVDLECPLAAVRIAPPVLGDTLDAVLLPSGARFETADKAAIDRLRALSRRPVPFARIYRAEQSWAIAILATAVVLAVLLGAYFWAIPFATLRIARASPALAQRIGQGTLALLDVELRPSELSPSERERLQAVFATVAADHPGRHLKLELRKAGVANAFSLPDGTLVLTDEIVHLSQHDDQLLGVLFHEAGHVVHGHGLRRVVESSVLALLATTYYGDADQVTAMAAGLPLAYARSHYSRDEELEADAAAFEGLRRHGKDARHFARILRALERATGGPDHELDYLSSHPATSERVRRLEAAAPP